MRRRAGSPYSGALWFHCATVCSRAPLLVSLTVMFCLVVAISDGDTLTARCGAPGRIAPSRYASPPLMPLKPNRRLAPAQAAPGAAVLSAKARLQPLTRDDYGRTVANVQCAGKDVAAAQVAAGMAWVYAPHAQQHPSCSRLQQRARSQRLGLWSQKRPLAPWTYRQRHRA